MNAGVSQGFPDMASFAAKQAMVGGIIEVIKQPIVDRILYPTAGIAGNLQFFTTPQGQGQSTESGAAAGVTKNATDTSMTQPGILPNPQAFWLDNIQCLVDAGSISTANLYATQSPNGFNATAAASVQSGEADINAILNSGVLVLTVGFKPYFTLGPLYNFPPQARKRLDAAVASNSATTAQVSKASMYADGVPGIPVRRLDPGIGLSTGLQFNVQLQWPVAIATPSGFNARIAVHLDGWTFRAAQ